MTHTSTRSFSLIFILFFSITYQFLLRTSVLLNNLNILRSKNAASSRNRQSGWMYVFLNSDPCEQDAKLDLSRLDQQELLRLALTAAQQHKHHEAITILQYALNQDSTDAHLHYYIGIEYAHIGHHERALAALECAVLQDPTLEIAIFQLGLLNLTLGRVAQANIAWQGLERFVASEALRLFCDGLRYLILNDPTACRVRLRRGMAINNKNPGLNADIARILDHVESIGMVGRALFPQSYKLPESINSHDGSFFIQGYHTPCNVTVH